MTVVHAIMYVPLTYRSQIKGHNSFPHRNRRASISLEGLSWVSRLGHSAHTDSHSCPLVKLSLVEGLLPVGGVPLQNTSPVFFIGLSIFTFDNRPGRQQHRECVFNNSRDWSQVFGNKMEYRYSDRKCRASVPDVSVGERDGEKWSLPPKLLLPRLHFKELRPVFF